MFQTTDTLGEVVARFPDAGTIFTDEKIDFCCRGQRTLGEAAQERQIDPAALVEQVNAAYAGMINEFRQRSDWQEASLESLIRHIVNTHHAYLNQILPELSQMTTKILRVHGARHSDVLAPVHRMFHMLKLDMEQHMIKEEEESFPMIIAYEQHPDRELLMQAIEAVEELESEHRDAGDILKEIRNKTGDYHLPEDACTTFAQTYRRLEELENDMFRHIHMENNILFPRLRATNAEPAAESAASPTA